MVLLRLLFIVCIASFLLGELIRIPILGFESRLLDITVLLLFLAWLAYLIKKRKLSKALYFPMFSFVVIGLISLILNFGQLNSDQVLKSAIYLLRWSAYAALIPVVMNFGESFKLRTKQALILNGGLIVTLGYIQYIFYDNLRNLAYLGWDVHQFRMFSVFLDPNFAGAFFVLYLIFLLNEIFKLKNKKIELIIYSILSVTTFLAVLLTFSRSAFLMLIVGLSTFLFLKKKYHLLIALALIPVLLTFLLPRAYKTEGTNFFRTVSSEARLFSSIEAINVFLKSPAFGVGFNAYQFAREKDVDKTPGAIISHAEASTDNSFLFVLATTGVLGFASFLYMWYSLLKINKDSVLVLSSVLALFIGSLFVNSLFYSPILFWIWTVIGLKENK